MRLFLRCRKVTHKLDMAGRGKTEGGRVSISGVEDESLRRANVPPCCWEISRNCR